MARVASTRSAADFIPPNPTLSKLREAARSCRGCDLWKNATQTVFGEGPAGAAAMFVGEQPGDQEDRVGRPFVGPAGRLLDEALASAGLDRDTVYVTNAVKHFKFVRQVLVKPNVVVALGSTAAQALLGNGFRVTQHRGELVMSEWAGPVIPTLHPSSVLRAPDEVRDEARRDFFRDIAKVADFVRKRRSSPPGSMKAPSRRSRAVTSAAPSRARRRT